MLNIGKFVGKFIKNSSERELDGLKSIIQNRTHHEGIGFDPVSPCFLRTCKAVSRKSVGLAW